MKRYERSNYGGTVDLAAPGAAVNSSLPGGKYGEMSGTSMAAPHVSAAAALLISELGASQTPSQIAAAIRGAARAIPKDAGDFEWQRYDGDDFLGAGFLDMRAFVPEPESKFYAHLYADGEMTFQTSKTPDPNKTLVETYPVTASEGAGEYAAWHNRRSEIRTVAFVDAIRPDSTALWFYGCENLTEIRGLENLDVSAVTNMSQMFSRCTSLETLDLSAWDTENVTDMRQMFFLCGALNKIYASGAFDVSNVENSDDMFMGCTLLPNYDAAHTDKEYARIDGGTSAPGYFTDKNAPQPSNDIYAVLYADGELVFQNNDRTESGRAVTDVYKVDKSYSYPDKAPWYEQCDSITTVTFASKIQPDSTAYWFYFCTKLEKIQNIKNLDTANVTDMDRMFAHCIKLDKLDVSCFDTSKVASMRGIFAYCTKLTILDLSGFDTSNVTSMSDMFQACKKLTALNLSGFDTSKVTSMYNMFHSCSVLTALNLSNFDTSNVTFMTAMFFGCSKLTALDLSFFNTSNVINMSSMFSGCSGLTVLDLSNFDTANVTDMELMFSGCSNLKTIYASDKFTTASVLEAEYYNSRNMFTGCASIVGGSGTKYDSGHTDKEYARIDGGPDAPGYFTLKDETANLSAEELFHLGEDYFNGANGKPQDYEKSRYYYQKSADKGNMYAINDLGYIYQKGYGVAVDYDKAFALYLQAADMGNPHALNNLGYMYENGYGVAKDYQQALNYYQRAADAGSDMAVANLAALRILMMFS